NIFIKFADFGLANEGENLNTTCGNATYVSPEIYKKKYGIGSGGSYTSAVDIWSAGVVVAELLCGLPDGTIGPTWHDDICARVREYHSSTRDPLAPFLLSSMLAIKPSCRAPAAECHRKALRLPDGSKALRKPQGTYLGVKRKETETEESTFRLLPTTVIFRGQDGSASSLDDASPTCV
ncbi:kinase-like domain-containing protein, partial [Diaporthe sp. PMI_573]